MPLHASSATRITGTVARARAPWSSSVARSRSVRHIARRRWAMSVGKSAASARASSSKAWRARMTAWRASVLSGSETSRRSYARSRSTRTVAAPDAAAPATRAA